MPLRHFRLLLAVVDLSTISQLLRWTKVLTYLLICIVYENNLQYIYIGGYLGYVQRIDMRAGPSVE